MQKIYLRIKTALTRSATAANEGIEIASVLSSVKSHTEVLCEDTVFKLVNGTVLLADLVDVTPLSGAVFLPSAISSSRREINTDGNTVDHKQNEDKLRAVYDYVQTTISYVNHSDKTDWVGEAYNGLFVTGTGDCFTYFAAAKAFLIHLDIQFIELQRAPGLTEETHFWMLVNIGDTPGVRTWYHYDATRLRAEYNHSGCLLTDQQALAYNKVRPHFYTHNTDCPATSDIIITETPELEAYYE